MRSTLSVFCLVTTLVWAPSAHAADRAPRPEAPDPAKSLAKIDGELQRGEWAAAEAEAGTMISDAMLKKPSGSFDAVARLAVAQAGLGRTEDALWSWSIAQNLNRNLQASFDLKPFGAPGELLASHPLRRLDEAPANVAGMAVRKPGEGTGPFSPPQPREAKNAEIPKAWGAIPRGIRLQAIVDAQGRPGQPVVTQSTSPAFTYVVLKILQAARFDPAKAGGAPVAAFYDLSLPARRPLAEVADFTGSPLAKPESALRAGHSREAEKEVETAILRSFDKTIPSRGVLGVALALKALAQAGEGDEDGAICRWQAAQTLEPRLYAADLSAYGVAGKLLDAHVWGEPFDWRVPGPDERPVILKRANPKYPKYARKARLEDTVRVEGILTTHGRLRNPVLLTPESVPGFELATLDTLCDWVFKPATYQGQPVAAYYQLSTKFQVQ
jgi:TonB family protein